MALNSAQIAARLIPEGEVHLGMAQWMAREHSRRHRMFSDLLPAWSEPIWIMLLDLYMAQESDTDLSTTSVCLASNIPVSSALRHILELCDRGHLRRQADENDGRRMLVSLSPALHARMSAYFQQTWADIIRGKLG